MEKLIGFLKRIWTAIKSLFLGVPKQTSQEPPKLSEHRLDEQQTFQQPQREIARPVPLAIASTEI